VYYLISFASHNALRTCRQTKQLYWTIGHSSQRHTRRNVRRYGAVNLFSQLRGGPGEYIENLTLMIQVTLDDL